MQLDGLIYTLPKNLKLLIGAFIIVLSIGFFTGLLFVGETSSTNPKGIEEQYLGNEEDEGALIMKFKKSEKEMLTLVHTHVLSMSIIFFLTGLILAITKLNKKLKLSLMIEPFLSVVLTFGGTLFFMERFALDEICGDHIRNANDFKFYASGMHNNVSTFDFTTTIQLNFYDKFNQELGIYKVNTFKYIY